LKTPLQEQWAKKGRFLTQALIFSGALNIGLLTSFFYFAYRDKKEAVAFELQPTSHVSKHLTNGETIAHFATMSYAELVDMLGSQDPVEEGYKKRDFALASLAAFHFIDLEKALHGSVLQKRKLTFQRKDGPELVDITVFPGVTEDQFQGIVQFINTEKFPLTAKGLFFELKHGKERPKDLLEAFYLTPEFTTLMTLFNRAGIPLPSEYVIEVIADGDWSLIEQFTQGQKLSHDLSPLRLKNLLSCYVRCRSVLAAKILLEWDRDFILKKLDDPDLMVFLDLFSTKTATLDTFLKEIITSPRSDAIWKKAAEKLYAFSDLPCPEPYDHFVTLEAFALKVEPLVVQEQVIAVSEVVPVKKNHRVQSGENLWKIARKYKVSIDALKKANQLETDKLRPGKELVIP